MSGHSHWAQIKHKKGAADVKRGALFSKLLKNISIAARDNPNPGVNPTLRSAIEKAKEANIPKENIERAVNRGDRSKTKLDTLLIEAYSPGGAALLVEVLTDSKNRALAEVRSILETHGWRLGEPGSARWAFREKAGWFETRVTQPIASEDRERLVALEEMFDNHSDVVRVISNAGAAS